MPKPRTHAERLRPLFDALPRDAQLAVLAGFVSRAVKVHTADLLAKIGLADESAALRALPDITSPATHAEAVRAVRDLQVRMRAAERAESDERRSLRFADGAMTLHLVVRLFADHWPSFAVAPALDAVVGHVLLLTGTKDRRAEEELVQLEALGGSRHN